MPRHIFAAIALLSSLMVATPVTWAQGLPSPAAPPAPAAVPATKPVAMVPQSLLRADTSPVEVLFLYDKMMQIEPSFMEMVYGSPAYLADPEGFNDYEVRLASANALQNLYDRTGPETVVYQHPVLAIEDFDVNMQGVSLAGLEPDKPFSFEVNTIDLFAIFMRNARDASMMAPPYEQADFSAISMLSDIDRQTMVTEVTLKPVIVDVKSKLYDGRANREIKTIIADVVEIKLFDPSGKKLLLQKRFKDWRPAVGVSPSQPGNTPTRPSGAMPAPSPLSPAATKK